MRAPRPDPSSLQALVLGEGGLAPVASQDLARDIEALGPSGLARREATKFCKNHW